MEMHGARHLIFVLLAILLSINSQAADSYDDDTTYVALYSSMQRSFNEADSAKFFPAVKKLEDFFLEKNDLHNYYTQRCNEIVFLMNGQRIFEAYMLGRKLSEELRERKLESEMYMAYNILGHIYRYCGNTEAAKRNFYHVIERMEEAGYRESMPPIYLNLASVEMDDNPEKAMELINRGIDIATAYAPHRVFDMEARRTLAYFEMGDTANFLTGYEAYKEGEAQGLSSVSGRQLEIYNLALHGKVDQAIKMAREGLNDDSYSTQEKLFKDAGRWQEAYDALKKHSEVSDSLNSLLLSNSMQGIQDQLRLYDAERKDARTHLITLGIIIILLLLLTFAMAYIVLARRRHLKQLNNAYQHALESDNMKSAFIRNVSHEVRTPLNIIGGFAQIIADPNLDPGPQERSHMAQMMQKNTRLITSLIDEMLELSRTDTTSTFSKEDQVEVNTLMQEIMSEEGENVNAETTLRLDTTLSNDFTIMTNRIMMKRIVSLLLNNAVKYTEQGHIVLRVSTEADMLNIAVEDTGCGIPQAEAERIFDRFVKLDTFKVGIGLGLPLSRLTARRMGGDVCLDTSYHDGARFIVTIPLM